MKIAAYCIIVWGVVGGWMMLVLLSNAIYKYLKRKIFSSDAVPFWFSFIFSCLTLFIAFMIGTGTNLLVQCLNK